MRKIDLAINSLQIYISRNFIVYSIKYEKFTQQHHLTLHLMILSASTVVKMQLKRLARNAGLPFECI